MCAGAISHARACAASISGRMTRKAGAVEHGPACSARKPFINSLYLGGIHERACAELLMNFSRKNGIANYSFVFPIITIIILRRYRFGKIRHPI